MFTFLLGIGALIAVCAFGVYAIRRLSGGKNLFTFLPGIGALMAANAVVVHVIALTIDWIKKKVKEKLALKKAKKTAFADIKETVKNCRNTMSLDDLDRLADEEGYTHLMVTLDDNDEIIGDLEMIKDTNSSLDPEVRRLLGKEGMVVIEK